MTEDTPCRKKTHYKRKDVVSKYEYNACTSRNMTVLTIHQAQ
jgi:hypothetical protein